MKRKETKKSSKEKTRDRIIKTAIESFKTQGYVRSTTLGIAEKAGVAEITLFRHFSDKKTLFKATVKEIAQDVPWDLIKERLSGNFENDLVFMANQMLTYFINQKDAIAMLIFESGHFSEMKEALSQNPKGTLLFLDGYFKKQSVKGIIEADNPQILSQMFISMLFGYAMGLEPVKDILLIDVSSKDIAQKFVKIFLHGINIKETIL